MPAWQDTPPRDPEAIKMLEEEYFRSNCNIRDMLRVLFNSDFFKNARFARVKSPVEVVAGTMRLGEEITLSLGQTCTRSLAKSAIWGRTC